MTPLQNLYYAIGEMAYAIAISDGEIQKAERQKLADIVTGHLENGSHGFDISGIIFHILDKQNAGIEQVYPSALREIRLNSHYLSPEMKRNFSTVIQQVAESFPPVTPQEKHLIEKFRREIEQLEGDPVYYSG